MKISDILAIESIKTNSKATDKDALIIEMLELADKSGQVENLSKASDEVFKRESVMSTGVGKGIALPHAKTSSVKKIVGALSILKTPLDYNSLDGEPVNIVFLLLGKQNNMSLHLQVLSKISRLLNNDSIKNELINADDNQTIRDIINKFDQDY